MAIDAKFGEVEVEVDSERHPLNGADEPVFVLRAQDADALTVLRTYRACHVRRLTLKAQVLDGMPDAAERAQAASAVVKDMDGDVIARFEEWQAANPDRVKQAGT